MIRQAIVAGMAIALIAGCGDSGESAYPAAGVAEITGPYQSEPFRAFDPSVIAAVEAACRTSDSAGSLIPVNSRVVLADARGRGRVFLLFAGANGATGECYGTVDANGRVAIEGTGGGGAGNEPPPAPLDLGSSSGMSSSGGPGGNWSAQSGTMGSEIGGVVIELGDGTKIVASTGSGRYSAWWPGDQSAVRILAYDRSGNLVNEQPN